MAASVGQLGPLPGGIYTGTMSEADIYPNHVGLSGPTTKDRTLPAYGELAARLARPGAVLEQGLIGTPAGYLALGLLALAVLAWYHGGTR